MTELKQALPNGAFLIAIAEANLPWKHALGELIDNALDAGAQTVTFDFSVKDLLIVVDDGRGCDVPQVMIQYGGRDQHPGTRLGRYGIGAKEAVLWIGGIDSSMEIESVCSGVYRRAYVNWREHVKNWVYQSDEPRDALAGEQGTRITITATKRRKSLPSGDAFKKLMDELGYIFAPAIKLGCQIKLRQRSGPDAWMPLASWDRPPDEPGYVHERITVGGKSALVHCTSVAAGLANPRPGFTYWHGWRVIEAASPHGCGKYSSSRICGVVQLDSGWRLTKLKDAIAGDAQALYDEVERVCLGLLQRAEQIGNTLESKHFSTLLATHVNQAVASLNVKAKRKGQPRREDGTGVKPTGVGGLHRQAGKVQPGSRFHGGRRFQIDFYNAGEPTPIGIIKDYVVQLNEDNPTIARAKQEQNIQALVVISIALVSAVECLAPNGQFPLLRDVGATRDFANIVGRLLSAPDLNFDGKAVLEVVRG